MCKGKCKCKATKDSYFFQDHGKKKKDDWYAGYVDEDDKELEDVDDEDEDEDDDLDIYEKERFPEKMSSTSKKGGNVDESPWSFSDEWLPESDKVETTVEDLKSDMLKFVDLLSVGALKNKMWVTTPVAAKWYRVNERTVRRWIEADKIVAMDIGVGQVRWLVEIGLHSRWYNPDNR